MAYQHSITNEIRQKTSNGDFSLPIKIGAEQRFVSPLLNSHNNNLEEQSILGTDCVSVYWDEGNTQYVTKKFYNGDLSTVGSNGYYILFIEYYDKSEFAFVVNTLYLPEYEVSKARFEQRLDEDVNLMGDDPVIYNFNEEGTLEINPSYRVVKKEVLCLRTNILDESDTQSESDIMISEKTTIQILAENGKTYIQESIVNHLND